uniref:Uncharacterized protein n=1 Tax=Solanum lycopersicum TaxID=4081 RepID=A0A3Q7IRN1_SOLLC
MPNFFVDVRQDLVYAYGWPSRLVRPIWKTSVKTLSMHTVGHRLVRPIWKVQRAPKRAYPSFRRFSCAKHTTFWVIRIPTSKMQKKFVDIRQDHIYACGWPSRLVRPILKIKRSPKRADPSFRRFSCIAHNFLGDPDSNVKNAKFFRGRLSRPCLCIRLAITAYPTHLEGQTSPEASIPLISMIFVCYSTRFFG